MNATVSGKRHPEPGKGRWISTNIQLTHWGKFQKQLHIHRRKDKVLTNRK